MCYGVMCVQQIAVVNQDPVLFSGTIRQNIEYGLKGCSLDKIKEAAMKANAHDFIMQLDKGYDTGEHSSQAFLHGCMQTCICMSDKILQQT